MSNNKGLFPRDPMNLDYVCEGKIKELLKGTDWGNIREVVVAKNPKDSILIDILIRYSLFGELPIEKMDSEQISLLIHNGFEWITKEMFVECMNQFIIRYNNIYGDFIYPYIDDWTVHYFNRMLDKHKFRCSIECQGKLSASIYQIKPYNSLSIKFEILEEHMKSLEAKVNTLISEKENKCEEDTEPSMCIDNDDDEGEMLLNYINTRQSEESMQNIVFDMMKKLTHLEDEGMIITECSVHCKYIENPNPADVQEYEQFTDDETNETITVDKTRIEQMKDAINQFQDPGVDRLRKLCDNHCSTPTGYIKDWMSSTKFNNFLQGFVSLHGILFPRINLKDFQNDDGCFNYESINKILSYHNINYEIIQSTMNFISPYYMILRKPL